MATCKNCIHEEVCKYTNEKISIGTTVGESIHECKDYTSTADVVEVVRCKDCVHYCQFEHCNNGICDVDVSAQRATYSTDFCSYGERKES